MRADRSRRGEPRRPGRRPYAVGACALIAAIVLAYAGAVDGAAQAQPAGQGTGAAGAWRVLAGDRTAPGEFNSPSGVTTDGDGNVYVADWQNHRIQKLTAAGQPLAQWGSLGSGPGQFD